MHERFQMGDRIERWNTGRCGTVINGDSLFVALVQWLNGEEEWVPASLLRSASHDSQTCPSD